MNPARPASRFARAWPPAVLVLAALLAWANSLAGPFVFDDRSAVLANPTLASLRAALTPPRDGGTVAGRPLVNLSFALNRALGGEAVGGYHALNLLVHVLAGLALFGVVRRTLRRRADSAAAAETIAFMAALLWLVHPLQTAAVTYLAQRAEALMALCFLLTLYAFIRSLDTAGGSSALGWRVASVFACLCGMAAKEVMVAAPLVVLLYDRTLVAGTFSAALRRRGRYYAALAATWLLLAALVIANQSRAGTAGFGGSVAVLDYARTQCGALVRYGALALWPRALVFDYGTPLVTAWSAVWPQALVVIAAVSGVMVALWRGRVGGFLGAAALLVLAPSSSVMPVATQTIAEHRVYLPLAALTIVVAWGLHRLCGARALALALGLALALAGLTARRNLDYRSALALWSDTVAKRPENARAQNHLGNALAQAGRRAAAIAPYEAALRLAPQDVEVHNNLGNALLESNRAAEALPHFAAAVAGRPDSLAARLNYARALTATGRADAALAQYAAAAQLGPLGADAEGAFGAALAAAGRVAESLPHYERALQLRPDDAQAHYNLGVALIRLRRAAPAVEHFAAAARLEPANVAAHVNLGNALLVSGRAAEAIAAYEAALRLRPDDRQIRDNLARARARR